MIFFSAISSNPLPVASNSESCNNAVIKNPAVDGNIITENDFLQKEVLYESAEPETTQCEILAAGTPAQNQILVLPSCKERFRKILPKKKPKTKMQDLSPAVVFLPVLNINSVSTQEKPAQQQPPKEVKQKEKTVNKKSNKGNKGNANSQKPVCTSRKC